MLESKPAGAACGLSCLSKCQEHSGGLLRSSVEQWLVSLVLESSCLGSCLPSEQSQGLGESRPLVLRFPVSMVVMTASSVSCSCGKESLVNRIHYLSGTSCVALFRTGFHGEFCPSPGSQGRGTAFLLAGA